MGQADPDREATPGVAPAEDDQGAVARLEVDGELFELRLATDGGTHYTWVTGPNPGYGFSMSPSPDSVEGHLARIQSFLAMIDPRTGYIGED